MFEPVSMRELASFIICAAFIGGYYFKWRANDIAERALNKPNTVIPQPIVVKADVEYATRKELHDTKAELSQRIEGVDTDLQEQKKSIITNGELRKQSIEGKVEKARSEAKAGIDAVSLQVTDTRVQVGRVEGELKQINLTLLNLNQTLQQIQVQNQQSKKH